jgi:voltage-gated potassium channel
VILCGLGNLGFRVLEQLVSSDIPVVVLEKNPDGKFLGKAREIDVPVLVRDMKEDRSLLEAGVEHARAIIIATNDDMANLEVALDARRLNSAIRVIMRLFDQQIAQKISGALSVDVVFSASAIAAPMVAAMSLETKVLSSSMIAGVPHVMCEVTVNDGSPMAGRRISELELGFAARVLACTPTAAATQSPPPPATTVNVGDTLVVHTASAQLATLAAASRGKID